MYNMNYIPQNPECSKIMIVFKLSHTIGLDWPAECFNHKTVSFIETNK